MNEQTKQLLQQMTVEEKVGLLSGKNFWNLKGVERLDIPEIMVTDGPHGLRKQMDDADHIGLNDSVQATCFPTAVGLAASWDKELLHEMGNALGEECLTEQVSVLLGPGANIKRHPLCGRNFEYLSEDPFVSGHMAAALIQGIQEKGIGTSMKHYVANNQETMRMAVDTIVDERTLRELYLKSFEIAVKKAQPWTVMCSYNKVNGIYVSEHTQLLQTILKDEWGHQGLVVTDWGACNDRVAGLRAGQDLEMPGSNGFNDAKIQKAVQDGFLDEAIVDERTGRVLELILKSKETLDKDHTPYNKEEHHALSRKIAAETICLLKNDNDTLPLNKTQSVALIGEFAVTPRYQGSGSSLITPTKITTALDGFKEYLGDKVTYAQGYTSHIDQPNDELIQEALEVTQNNDVVVIMVGLTDSYESEGFDRTHLNIPKNHVDLIDAITKVHPNVIAGLSNGSPVTMPWKDNVNAIVEQYLGGQASGGALADVLFGSVNPSAKLAETFPNNVDEFPANQQFPGEPRQVQYREGLYVGYRYYDTAQIDPLFPFGFGLSYTTFEYSNLGVSLKDDITVSYDITNTGTVDGKEISQVYVKKLESAIHRPEKELKGFDKTFIKAGETVTVTVTIPLQDLEVYVEGCTLEQGDYTICVGSSSKNIHLKDTITVEGKTLPYTPSPYDNVSSEFAPTKEDFEDVLGHVIPPIPPVRPFTINSVIGEMQGTMIGRMLKKTISKEIAKMSGEEDVNESMVRMVESMVNELPMRGLIMLGGDAFSEQRAMGLLDLMNKRIFRGLYRVIKG